MILLFSKSLKYFLLISFFINLLYYKKNIIFNSKNYKKINYENNNLFNKISLNFNNLSFEDNKIYYFKVISARYSYSLKYKITKFEYNIALYDKKENLIYPSDFSLKNNISLICNVEIKYYNISIDSLAGIKKNNYFNCIEYFNINEEITFGIKLYDINKNVTLNYIMLSTDSIFNYNTIKLNDDIIFDLLIMNKKFISSIKNINNNKKLNKLKSSYIKYPFYSLKRNCNPEENIWKFQNNFGEYFCFCKGQNCLKSKIVQNCKFFFYIYLIDNNRKLYLKTDYLFADLIFSELSSDDVYPVFEKMKKENFPVHYITEKIDIYQKYCNKTNDCLTIIPFTKDTYYSNGDFLQKYFTTILKSKAFISGKNNYYNGLSILFYNIEYITYIGVGHGLCYFKDYLYKENRLYGIKNNDKLLIPPSEKIILLAKKYGWKDENIIKINFPRWDKYNNEKLSYDDKINFSSQSIFLMFTWRAIKKGKEISYHYINNTISLLINDKLRNILNKKNMSLYFSFHRFIEEKYRKKFFTIISSHKYIKYINQDEISDIISKASLFISDFSSIIFDFIYKRKPFIIYIPDVNDSFIKNIYYRDYYQLIESLKNQTIYFMNKYFEINSVVEKIIYYINNNFKIEKNLMKFYDSFELNQGENINNFINYLHNIK